MINDLKLNIDSILEDNNETSSTKENISISPNESSTTVPNEDDPISFSGGIVDPQTALNIMYSLEQNPYKQSRYLSHLAFQHTIQEKCFNTFRIALACLAALSSDTINPVIINTFVINGRIQLTPDQATQLWSNKKAQLESQNKQNLTAEWESFIDEFTENYDSLTQEGMQHQITKWIAHANKGTKKNITNTRELTGEEIFYYYKKLNFINILDELTILMKPDNCYLSSTYPEFKQFAYCIAELQKHLCNNPDMDIYSAENKKIIMEDYCGTVFIHSIAAELKKHHFHLAVINNPHGRGSITQAQRTIWAAQFIKKFEPIQQEIISFLISQLFSYLGRISTSANHMDMRPATSSQSKITFNDETLERNRYFFWKETPTMLYSEEELETHSTTSSNITSSIDVRPLKKIRIENDDPESTPTNSLNHS